MTVPDSSKGQACAVQWKAYAVRRSDKQKLLSYVTQGLEIRGCKVLFTTEPSRAPFYVVFETPSGERNAVLVYAFHAGARVTANRPDDEHRFQVKYGSQLKGTLEVAIDASLLVTTIFLGIDTERGIFVAADPLMNAPSPMSRSIEFKAHHVDSILREGWHAWERERHPPKTKSRPTPKIDEDTRIQVLVGGTQDHIYDLILLERLAHGLDPGERHLLADQLSSHPSKQQVASNSHQLLDELGVSPDALFDLIEGAARLKMAVRGWVAEQHLANALKTVKGVSDCRRLEAEGQPDITLRWKGSAPILIECKNVLRKTDAQLRPRLDFQRTRASKADPCSRYYKSGDFCVLAACLHAVTTNWEFRYAVTSDLPQHPECTGRITNNLRVSDELFTKDVKVVLERCAR